MKTRVLMTLVVVLIAAFATIQAFSQTQQQEEVMQPPVMPPFSHELPKLDVRRQPTGDAASAQTAVTVPANPRLLGHVESDPGIYGMWVTSNWETPWANPKPIKCPVACVLEVKVTVSIAYLQANNTFAAGVVIANQKGASIPLLPFAAVGLLSTTADMGSGITTPGPFTFKTGTLPAGTYWVNAAFGDEAFNGATAGDVCSASQFFTIDAYSVTS